MPPEHAPCPRCSAPRLFTKSMQDSRRRSRRTMGPPFESVGVTWNEKFDGMSRSSSRSPWSGRRPVFIRPSRGQVTCRAVRHCNLRCRAPVTAASSPRAAFSRVKLIRLPQLRIAYPDSGPRLDSQIRLSDPVWSFARQPSLLLLTKSHTTGYCEFGRIWNCTAPRFDDTDLGAPHDLSLTA